MPFPPSFVIPLNTTVHVDIFTPIANVSVEKAQIYYDLKKKDFNN